MKKNTIIVSAISLVVLGLGVKGAQFADRLGALGAGFMARDTCSEIFIAGRELENILANDFEGYDPKLKYVGISVDPDQKSVTGRLGPFGKSTAVFREGYGCTLIRGELSPVPPLAPITNVPWESAEPVSLGIDTDAFETALDSVFKDQAPDHRAMFVVKKGKVIGERYASGFDTTTPMLSFSMAKSVTAMMVGAAIQDGYFGLDDTPPILEWSGKDDPRSQITWRHLLQMQTGLEFDERYLSIAADVPTMNILEHSAAAYAFNKPLEFEPGTKWKYSTGTSNILQHALRKALENAGVNYHSYARDTIFEPLGAKSIVFIPDSAGDFIGGSYVYATAADWAKLGQLYVQNGIWNGRQILPEDWTEFSRTPASASDNWYGAQVWLNHPGADKRKKFFPDLPDATFAFDGWRGQFVMMIPEEEIVIVHLGRTSVDTAATAINAAGRVYKAMTEGR
ncbi:MAG: serine hydrolase [Pseudomonadota bacterium]